jgi:PAS domain S-box-containing protein
MKDCQIELILVVDDEKAHGMVTRKLLQKMGYECTYAEDAFEALKLLGQRSYDLLISDIRMAGKDGLSLTREVREKYTGLDVIIMTGHAGEYSYIDIIEAGANEFIAKPFSFGELLAKIKRIERERRIVHDLRKTNEALSWQLAINASIAELSRTLIPSLSAEEISTSVLRYARQLTESPLGYLGIVKSLDALETDFPDSGMSVKPAAVAECFGDSPVHRAISAPISLEGNLPRHLVVANSGRDYTEEDRTLVERLANIYALAIQRRETEDQLRWTKDYLENVFETSAEAIGIADAAGRCVKWNKAAEILFGYTFEELKDERFEKLYADRASLDSMLAQLRQKGSIRHYEIEMLRKDGKVVPFDISISILKDKNDRIAGSITMAMDLSKFKNTLYELRSTNERLQQEIIDRKKAEEELLKTHTEMQLLFSSIPSILIGVSSEDCITRWNPAAEKTFGLMSTEVLGRPLGGCDLQWDWDRLSESISECRKVCAPARLDDLRFTRRDGKEGFLRLGVSNVVVDVDCQLSLVIMGSDITERKILEAQLVQAQKLESIGQLAAGIAHEINTPTQYVGDNTRFLRDAFADLEQLLRQHNDFLDEVKAGASSRETIMAMEDFIEKADVSYLMGEIPLAINQSIEGIERVSKIVHAMKEFSHPGSNGKIGLDINRAIESTITVARNEWKYVAEMKTELDRSLPLVPCLPAEFNQVILNIIINAAHAISERIGDGSGVKGIISVSTRKMGDMAEISIADTGNGVPAGIRSRIFDPFFTTKDVGKGTGQGLAIAHSVIVEKHGGTITFETEVGRGTTFVIRLPLTGPEPVAEPLESQ